MIWRAPGSPTGSFDYIAAHDPKSANRSIQYALYLPAPKKGGHSLYNYKKYSMG